MTENFTHNGKHFVMDKCPTCGTLHAFEYELYKVAQQRCESESICCPNGHKWHYKSRAKMDEEARIRQERDRLRQQIAQKDDELAEERRKVALAQRAAKAQVTRLKNRAKAGLCPCCNRHFTNLERHMTSKHQAEVLQ